MTRPSRVFFLLVCILAPLAPLARAVEPAAWSHIVAFGDSLSSGGRGKSGPSTGPAPTVTNGNYPRLTWVQQLSEMANRGVLAKWEDGGSNYAVGGSTTGQLVEQVSRYLKSRDDRADSSALYTLWSGANDLTHQFRDRYKQNGFFSLFGLEDALVARAEKAADALESQIDRLARAGAIHVLWVNLPDLSRTPSLAVRTASFPGFARPMERAFRHSSDAFNRRMACAVERLRFTHPSLKLVVIDAHTFFAELMADPAALGFTDIKTPSRTSKDHLFYDNAHPTAHGHFEFARFALRQLAALGYLPEIYSNPVSWPKTSPLSEAPAPTVPPAAADDPAAAAFVAHIRQILGTRPILRRPYSLTELASDPAFQMKYREKPAHLTGLDEAGWERFALSLADAEAAKKILQLLPTVATAARLSDDPALLSYVRDQLDEVATWAPLQRAGWSGGSATPGAWLGTGWAVRAIVQTLVQLPETALTPELRASLAGRLEAEIVGIREDWRTRRTWFARDEAASSNQWVLPLEALALASLFSGLDQHRDDFEFAVSGLLRSLDAQGRAGECVEGMQYGSITYESVLSAALVARSFGDERLFKHPWLHAFPTWYLHHRQPGGFVINAFDSNPSDLDWTLVAQIAAELADPAALWALSQRPTALPPSPAFELALRKIAQTGVLDAARPPALFAAYPVAARINWLESTAAFASGPANHVSGFWMRGGHESDAHDHQDRGHVNFVSAGRPVLIEAGLSSYGIPDHPTHFKSVAGHNVLQVGAFAPASLTPRVLTAGAGQILDPAHRAAPLTLHRLEAAGGEVSVDASNCYASVNRWIRTATWDATMVTIRDEVELAQPDIVLFRWHLGEPADASATRTGPGQLSVGNIALAYETTAETPLHAEIESMPDHTLHPGKVSQHATVVLQTDQPVQRITLTTRVSLVSTVAR